MITKLIHDLTQHGYSVEFSDDFEGMLTLTYKENGEYIRHEHLGYPGCPLAVLEKNLQASLEQLISEIQLGKVQRDGLAKPKG